MPIYEYRCPNGHTFEVFQRMSDPPASRVRDVRRRAVEKVLFPVAVHFKARASTATDYGRGSRKSSGKGRRLGIDVGRWRTREGQAGRDADSKKSDSPKSDT
jgi:putative FmdB family regulatory protein